MRMGSARTQVAVHEQPTQDTSRDRAHWGTLEEPLSTGKPLELLPRLHDSGRRGAPGWGSVPRDSNKQGPGQDQGSRVEFGGKNSNHGTSVCLSLSCSAVPDSLRPSGLQPTRLLGLWDFPGKDTGVVCHFLLQGITAPVEMLILYQTLCSLRDSVLLTAS